MTSRIYVSQGRTFWSSEVTPQNP